eukprot:TRINITY_DN10790_c0_g1_i1.p1 TRINITY_DN10790_c0_g1~~TRINITY_DN10790_c0_g1_i1.p1  ORF type:complete len:256 (-),score=18.02 TRINITY_DN10790_c0_g1_i1:118-801(-)
MANDHAPASWSTESSDVDLGSSDSENTAWMRVRTPSPEYSRSYAEPKHQPSGLAFRNQISCTIKEGTMSTIPLDCLRYVPNPCATKTSHIPWPIMQGSATAVTEERPSIRGRTLRSHFSDATAQHTRQNDPFSKAEQGDQLKLDTTLPGKRELWGYLPLGRSPCSQDGVPKAAAPSDGSSGHPLTCGPPCKYASKAKGCKDGSDCDHCHLCVWMRRTKKGNSHSEPI